VGAQSIRSFGADDAGSDGIVDFLLAVHGLSFGKLTAVISHGVL
jgi:hypothetical protein